MYNFLFSLQKKSKVVIPEEYVHTLLHMTAPLEIPNTATSLEFRERNDWMEMEILLRNDGNGNSFRLGNGNRVPS